MKFFLLQTGQARRFGLGAIYSNAIHVFAISGYLHQGQRTGLRYLVASVHCPINAINAFPSTIARVYFARGPVADLGIPPSHRRRTVTRVQHIRDWLTISLKKFCHEREHEISTLHPHFVTFRSLLLIAAIISYRRIEFDELDSLFYSSRVMMYNKILKNFLFVLNARPFRKEECATWSRLHYIENRLK